jgi:competence protein ComEC
VKKHINKRLSLWDIVYAILFAIVVLSILFLVRSCHAPSKIPDCFSVTALDVGQGQSIVLYSDGFTAVVDCGSSSVPDAGVKTGEYLLSTGCDKIDYLILSHYHSDHTNGLPQLADIVDIDTILLPFPPAEDSYISDRIVSLADRSGIDLVYVSEDLSLKLGNAELTLFAPLGSETENENCVIVLCSQEGFDVLMTADVPSDIEYRLLQHNDLPDIEILIAGHHGSAGSTSQDLLDTVLPEIAIISVGENEYGHPAASLLKRLEANGIAVYRTDESGNITFSPEKR